MKILFVFLFFLVSEVLSDQWVDPHDMNTNAKHYLKKSSSTGDLVYKKENCNVQVEESNSLIYLKRVLNLILNSADINKSDSLEHHGNIHFTISHEDLMFLKSFSTMQNVNIEDLRKMDTILSNSLQRSYFDDISSMFMAAQDQVYQLISSQNCLPLLALSFCFPYVVYNLYKTNFSLWYAFKYLMLMILMIDFVQRYRHLSQDADEHNMDLKYSLKCDTSKMTWGEYFKFMTSHEDCEKKVVSLLEVGLNQVKSVIIIPLSAVGTGMGHFASELWKNLPFPWNILIFPIMLIFCAILTAILMTTMNNTPFKFNIMHLFHLEFGEKKQEITGKALEKILDAVSHRQMLQEVKSARDETPSKKEKKYRQKKVNPPKPIENVEKQSPKKETESKVAKVASDKKQLNKVQTTVCEQDNGVGNSG